MIQQLVQQRGQNSIGINNIYAFEFGQLAQQHQQTDLAFTQAKLRKDDIGSIHMENRS